MFPIVMTSMHITHILAKGQRNEKETMPVITTDESIIETIAVNIYSIHVIFRTITMIEHLKLLNPRRM